MSIDCDMTLCHNADLVLRKSNVCKGKQGSGVMWMFLIQQFLTGTWKDDSSFLKLEVFQLTWKLWPLKNQGHKSKGWYTILLNLGIKTGLGDTKYARPTWCQDNLPSFVSHEHPSRCLCKPRTVLCCHPQLSSHLKLLALAAGGLGQLRSNCSHVYEDVHVYIVKIMWHQFMEVITMDYKSGRYYSHLLTLICNEESLANVP